MVKPRGRSPLLIVTLVLLAYGSSPDGRLLAQQGGAGALIQDPLVGGDNDNPLGFVCSQGIDPLGTLFLSSLPGSASVGPCSYAGGVGYASASWGFGSIATSARLVGGYSPGSNCCEAAFAGSAGIFRDMLVFNSGFVPTEIVFHYALRLSALQSGYGGLFDWGAQIGTSFENRVFINGSGTGIATFQTLGASTFSFFGFSGLSLQSTYVDYADFAAGFASFFDITGIQFFSNGVDVTELVYVTFASGHAYRFGAPLGTVVPEPGNLLLVATGLLGIALISLRRGRKREPSSAL